MSTGKSNPMSSGFSTPIPSGRGVQLHDVAAAADALVAAGQRPTIERVRQQIGRGSPNTIAPLLDAWFEGLGERLGLSASADPATPALLQQAMQALWRQALEQAGAHAQQALFEKDTALGVRAAELEGGWAALREQTVQLEAREQLLQERLDALQQEVQAARDSAQAAQRKVEQLDARLQEATQALQLAQQARNEERLRHDAQLQSLLADAEQQRALHQREQQRLLNQVDRERQAAKQANTQLQALQHAHQEALTRSAQDLAALRTEQDARLQAAQLELAALRAREQSLQERVQALQRIAADEPQGKSVRARPRVGTGAAGSARVSLRALAYRKPPSSR